MPKKDLTLLACVLDRSGSMELIVGDAVGGFNAFIESQKKEEGECKITLALFNDKYELRNDFEPIENIKPFTPTSYAPMGSTALLDAVGKTINSVGQKLDSMDESEKPEKVLFIILTDGQENHSKEFTLPMIQEMIKRQQDEWNWEFIYLAADQEGFEAGQTMGFVHSSKFNVNNTRGAYNYVCQAVSQYRCSDAGLDLKENID